MTAKELRKIAGQEPRLTDLQKDIKCIDNFLVKQAKKGRREAVVRSKFHKEDVMNHYKDKGFDVTTRFMPEDYIRIRW